MKGLVHITEIQPSKKREDGVRITPYFFDDGEGIKSIAFCPSADKPKVGMHAIVQLKWYKGKYYFKHLQLVDTEE